MVSHAGSRDQCVTNGIVMNARALRIITQIVKRQPSGKDASNVVELMPKPKRRRVDKISSLSCTNGIVELRAAGVPGIKCGHYFVAFLALCILCKHRPSTEMTTHAVSTSGAAKPAELGTANKCRAALTKSLALLASSRSRWNLLSRKNVASLTGIEKSTEST